MRKSVGQSKEGWKEEWDEETKDRWEEERRGRWNRGVDERMERKE